MDIREIALEQLHAAVSGLNPVSISGFALELGRQPDPEKALLIFSWALRNRDVMEDLRTGQTEQEKRVTATLR